MNRWIQSEPFHGFCLYRPYGFLGLKKMRIENDFEYLLFLSRSDLCSYSLICAVIPTLHGNVDKMSKFVVKISRQFVDNASSNHINIQLQLAEDKYLQTFTPADET